MHKPVLLWFLPLLSQIKKTNLKMKKLVLISLLVSLSTSASALNLFGIEYNGNTTDNLINLIYNLAKHDEEQAAEYHRWLEKTDPKLAADLKIEELKIPCSRCQGKGTIKENEPCPACEGTGLVTDSNALGYLQHKFCSAIDSGKTDAEAWEEAKAAFDKRRKIVLFRETLSGTLIRKESNGLLLFLQGSDEMVYVAGLHTQSSREGTPINGYVWPTGTHTFRGEDGTSTEVKSYTAALWTD